MNLSASFLLAGRRTVVGLAALATTAGCTGAAGAGVTPTAVPTATATTAAAASAAPSDTPQPTATATITVTPTPSVLTVTSKEGDVPCRFGPGSEYSVENALLAGKVVPVQGRDAASEWIQIDHPRRPDWKCWVEAAVTVVDGDLARAPVVAAPQAFVVSISIDTDHTMLGAGCTFPRAFEVVSWITTNGPAKVTFQRVRDGQQGDIETTVFGHADTKQYIDVYNLSSTGDHSFAVVVFSPNGISETKDFSVQCGP